MYDYQDAAVKTLSDWTRINTVKGEAAPRFPLETALIMVNDGLRRPGLEDLVLFNYHPTAAFRGAEKWLDIEKAARGLVLEKQTGRVIARPFVKFFNYGELAIDKEVKNSDIANVTYKEDGSLGIVFEYNGEWWVVTHGSLSSDQGIKATEILRRYDTSVLDSRYTYMVEIIYPENRIVTNYGDAEGLILLGVLANRVLDRNIPQSHIDEVKEKVFVLVSEYSSRVEFNLTNQNVIQEIVDYCDSQTDFNFEGVVVMLKDGRRMKFKTKEYLSVHRCRFAVSEEKVLDLMINSPETLIQWKETLPNEFFEEVDGMVERITNYTRQSFDQVARHLQEVFAKKDLVLGVENKHVGRIIHKEVKELPKHLQDAAFTMAKGYGDEKTYKVILKTYQPK